MELKEQFYVAKRVKKVIESCNTVDQLEGARNYLNLFFRKFSTPSVNSYGMEVVEADHSTIKLYNNLWTIWEEKMNLFK